MTIDPAALGRFTGFADVYDANRPSPPADLGHLLAAYSRSTRPMVVDLGSGTGLSSRWAASWAASVVGVEPNPDMRAMAEAKPLPGVEFRDGRSDDTRLPGAAVDVVVVVQAMHWMEPEPTLAEVSRILRRGGVLAVIDADWPPVSGVERAENAWAHMHRRMRVLEARLAGGATLEEVRRPVADDDPVLADDDLVDPHRNRVMPGGLRSWSKSRHLERMRSSGYFGFTREVVFNQPVGGGADRFKLLMTSQGSYQGLLKAGLSDQDIGAVEFEREVDAGFAEAATVPELSFCWRARIGIKSG